jgi:HK97 family phage portal protein
LLRAEKRTGNLTATDYVINGRFGRAGTNSGVTVNNETALRHSAVWACLSTIAEAIQQLPLEEHRVGPDGVTTKSAPPALFFQPTPDLAWETWIWQQTWTLALKGNCYAYVATVDARGWPASLIPVDPSCVRWSYNRKSRMWDVSVDGEPEQVWPSGRLWHCPLYTQPGSPVGMSPIAAHAESIGIGLAATEFGARFFGDGGHPTMIARPATDPGDDGAKSLKEKLMGIMQGSREIVVIPQNIELERVQIAPNESQFLDTIQASGQDVARIFGVPPGKVGLSVSGQNVTYTNTAAGNAEWRTSGLSRYMIPLEAGLSRLVPNGSRRVLRFNLDAFLRADLTARAAFYKTAAEIGNLAGTPLLQVNEMRAEEGLPPLSTGDTFDRPKTGPEVSQSRQLAEMIQKIYLGVDVVLTDEEARSILNDAGADLPGALPTKTATLPPKG